MTKALFTKLGEKPNAKGISKSEVIRTALRDYLYIAEYRRWHSLKQANTYTFPNQKIVTVDKTPCQGTLFAQYNMEAFLDAAQSLDAGAFKLWCYLGMNQDEYTFALTSKDAKERFGLGKSQYDTAIGKLIAHGYLINKDKDKGKDEQGNRWFFKDIPELEPPCTIPLFESQTSPCSETAQCTAKSEVARRMIETKEMRHCIETKQGLHENDVSVCIETSRSSGENQTRNNINNINSINIEYDDHDNIEDEREMRIGNHQTIPYSKEALADAELIKEITSVPGNYFLIKEALGNNEIPGDLEERYRRYLSDVDNGYIGDLISIR